jgi:hypothetical protein
MVGRTEGLGLRSTAAAEGVAPRVKEFPSMPIPPVIGDVRFAPPSIVLSSFAATYRTAKLASKAF